ncbi:hypothetical protein P3G55_00275 [Leptospira sp. 96542]|nr:hypothetical protein [Leptospira sp. 96542]
MRKFPKTIPIELEYDHLSQTETKTMTMLKDWENRRTPFLGEIGMDWETSPLPLLHSRCTIFIQKQLGIFSRILFGFFPHWYENLEKTKIKTQIDRELGTNIDPTSPKIKFWKVAKKIYLWNVTEFRANLNHKDPISIDGVEALNFNDHWKLHIRLGFLDRIEYLFSVRKFNHPCPKLAECYILRKENLKTGYGESIYQFVGFLFERQEDEYLLEYYGILQKLPKNFREQIPADIWSLLRYPVELKSVLYLTTETNLKFRPVDLVSTSSLDHPK